jgi:hypothetical protein
LPEGLPNRTEGLVVYIYNKAEPPT